MGLPVVALQRHLRCSFDLCVRWRASHRDPSPDLSGVQTGARAGPGTGPQQAELGGLRRGNHSQGARLWTRSSGRGPEARGRQARDTLRMKATDDTTGRVRLMVELDREAQPPSGWIQVEKGERREFANLLELISLLESARAGPGLAA